MPEKPDAAVWGAFAADGGHKPEVILAAGLVNDPQVISRSRRWSRLHFIARRPCQGVSADHCLGPTRNGPLRHAAQRIELRPSGVYFGPPHYKAHYAILGDRHVSGVDQLFSAIRFRFGDPYWLGHLREGKAMPSMAMGPC